MVLPKCHRGMIVVPSSCALFGGFAICVRISLLYDNIVPNAKCQRVLVLALCMVVLYYSIILLYRTVGEQGGRRDDCASDVR